MKKNLKSLLLMAVAVVMATAFAACSKNNDEESQPAKYYTVAGKVTDFHGKAISGATMTLTSSTNTSDVLTQTTAADGTFKFDKVKEGIYSTAIIKDKYKKYSENEAYVFRDYPDCQYILHMDPASFPPSTDELVDLGLPSGTKWASCNLGAGAPEKSGTLYAWGELETKEDFSKETSLNYGRVLPDISGNTEYDAAAKISGGKMCIPNRTQVSELIKNCDLVPYTYNDVAGCCFIGSTEKSIFIPYAGFKKGTTLSGEGIEFGCWLSEQADVKTSYTFFRLSESGIGSTSCYYGGHIRPVGK